MATIEAFSQDLVARITRLTRRQLEYWDQIGFIRPSIAQHELPGLPRLYSFRDLLMLKVAAEMRARDVLPGEMKARVEELEGRGISDPLLTLRIVGDPAGDRGRAFWIDPRTDAPMSWRDLDQPALVYDLTLRDLRSGLEADIREHTTRREGQVERVRGVQGSQPVIAGTRVPTSKVATLAAEGWSHEEIRAALPSLSKRDIQAAIAWERKRPRARRRASA